MQAGAARGFGGQVGQQVNEDADAVVVGFVVVNLGANRILDLDANHIAEANAVPHHNVAALANVDARIIYARGGNALNQHIAAVHRVHAINSGVLHEQITQHNAGRAIHKHAVVAIVAQCQVLYHHIVAGGRYAVGMPALPVQHRLLTGGICHAAQREVGRVRHHGLVVDAGFDLNNIAGDGAVDDSLDRCARLDAQSGRCAGCGLAAAGVGCGCQHAAGVFRRSCKRQAAGYIFRNVRR